MTSIEAIRVAIALHENAAAITAWRCKRCHRQIEPQCESWSAKRGPMSQRLKRIVRKVDNNELQKRRRLDGVRRNPARFASSAAGGNLPLF
jgi:hypothetical protein